MEGDQRATPPRPCRLPEGAEAGLKAGTLVAALDPASGVATEDASVVAEAACTSDVADANRLDVEEQQGLSASAVSSPQVAKRASADNSSRRDRQDEFLACVRQPVRSLDGPNYRSPRAAAAF